MSIAVITCDTEAGTITATVDGKDQGPNVSHASVSRWRDYEGEYETHFNITSDEKSGDVKTYTNVCASFEDETINSISEYFKSRS